MRTILFLICLVISIAGHSQSIIVNATSAPETDLGPEDLTREVLINGGACSDISNFTKKDNPQQEFPSVNRSWGYFQKGSSDFPFESGIVLTSGFAKNAQGPSGGNPSDGNFSWGGQDELTTLAGIITYNTTVFEFDFVPYGDEISFNYIFASSEYPEWVCGIFNDVFAFIISGPGITNDPGLTGKNIALLPNGDPVIINNVNNQWCGDDTYYVDGPFQDIMYDGRTTPLTAYSQVIPGETYHIKLMIADASDPSFDSAVFLEAGSFNLGSTFLDINGSNIEEEELICDQNSYSMFIDVMAPDATYQWYFNGEPIFGETNSNYTATVSGNYSVEVFAYGCSDTREVELVFSTSPTTIAKEDYVCTETGSYIFNLSEYNEDISSLDNSFSYYNSELGAEQEITLDEITDFTNFQITSAEGIVQVFVRVENSAGCFDVALLELAVGIGPETASNSKSVCDENGDGIAEFNLEELASEVLVNPPSNTLDIEYFMDGELTLPVPNPTNFENTTNPQVIYFTFIDTALGTEACKSVGELTLIVEEFPEIQSDAWSVCDNLNDNSEFIDLTQNEIVQTEGITVSFAYFEQDGTPIPDPTNHEITSSPTVINVLVRNENGTCEEYSTITLDFLLAPEAIDDPLPLVYCSLNEFANFNLTDLNEFLINENPADFNFTYHLTENNALNNEGALPDNYTNVQPDQTIYVRIENSNGCFDIAEIILDTELVYNQLAELLEVCDDPYEVSDGIGIFDLTEMQDLVENSLGGNGYTIKYYTSFENAIGNTNAISNPSEFQNTASPQTIFAVASDGINGCAGIVDFRINVLPVPEFELPEYLAFCNYDEKEYQFLNSFSSYTWMDADGNVISNDSSVSFSQEGIYTLEVLSDENECPARRDVEVIFDNQPNILDVEVNEHTIVISVAGGHPPYQYSINNGLTWTNDPTIHNVPGGIYELIVKTKYGCISTAKSFGVLGVPNFISPNGDGKNDYWEIRGLEAYPDAHIKIFDRFGKIFIDRPLTTSFRWDGKYLGNPVTSGDYWYIITVEEGKSISGHISVMNR